MYRQKEEQRLARDPSNPRVFLFGSPTFTVICPESPQTMETLRLVAKTDGIFLRVQTSEGPARMFSIIHRTFETAKPPLQHQTISFGFRTTAQQHASHQHMGQQRGGHPHTGPQGNGQNLASLQPQPSFMQKQQHSQTMLPIDNGVVTRTGDHREMRAGT